MNLPDAALSRLRAGADREGFDPRQVRSRWRYEWRAFWGLPSAAVRLRWLGQPLFPTADSIRSRYDVRHALRLPWFYGVRFARGLGKWLRRNR
ncbi:MAG: hypothetical protein V9H25_05215 [Candidatus Competibacter sp.]